MIPGVGGRVIPGDNTASIQVRDAPVTPDGDAPAVRGGNAAATQTKLLRSLWATTLGSLEA